MGTSAATPTPTPDITLPNGLTAGTYMQSQTRSPEAIQAAIAADQQKEAERLAAEQRSLAWNLRFGSSLVPDAWLTPSVVVEVLADEITPSPRHTAEFALRFPRIVSMRTDDKKAEDATTVREIREMYEQQRQRSR